MDWGITIGSVFFSSIDIIVFALCMFGGIGGAITDSPIRSRVALGTSWAFSFR
jgi:hypothetical protein